MDTLQILKEITYKAVRSSGAGGQNVNKVSSKVVLTFDINQSLALEIEEKNLIINKISSRLTSENILILNCDEDRSQLKNKAIVTKRFVDIISNALKIPIERKPTKIPHSVIKKRLNDKKTTTTTKNYRKKPDLD